MKKLALTALGIALLTGSAMARPHGGVFVSFGGGYAGGYSCGPRYYAPPVCYTPRAYYCPPPVAYCAPVVYSAPVVYAPAPIYRAPIVTTSVSVSPVVFGWRR
jgi:hypothetical protein